MIAMLHSTTRALRTRAALAPRTRATRPLRIPRHHGTHAALAPRTRATRPLRIPRHHGTHAAPAPAAVPDARVLPGGAPNPAPILSGKRLQQKDLENLPPFTMILLFLLIYSPG
jgi:hypothetical protein